ncbi:aquaporin-11 isoform X2 [Vicugna pacos]|uniref:Aquaporin-11 isoform X2 n=1 Tax=Vicugna pacos TaxID=30538 RepID=A0ABM5DWH4_VICPA
MTALWGPWPEVQDTCTSLGLMLLNVLFMGLARVVTRQQLNRPTVHAFILEFLATFQLCFCTHELQLLSEQEPLHPTWPLTLIYFFSLVHGLTLVGTSSNPCGVMMQIMLGGMSAETGALRLLAQVIGALCSRHCISALWNLGLTKYHVSERSFACRNPIQVDLPKAVVIEAVCSFIFHSALLHFQEVRTKLRIHLLSALITFLVYADADGNKLYRREGRICIFEGLNSHSITSAAFCLSMQVAKPTHIQDRGTDFTSW